MPRALRTVVTGHDEQGRSMVLSDRIAGPESPSVYIPKHDPNVALSNIWSFNRVPTDHGGAVDGEAAPFTLKPRTGGAIFRCIEIPPEAIRRYDGIEQYFSGMDAAGDMDRVQKKHPAMHKTKTVDVLVVLEGEIWLILDEGEVHLRQGDFIVQRATNHAWSNRTDSPCLIALILVDADEAP